MSRLNATTGCSAKGLILTTPIQDPTLPRVIVSPLLCNGLHYQVTNSSHTDTRAHPNKGNRLTSQLQQATVPRDLFHENRYNTPHYQWTLSHPTATTGCSTKWLIPKTPIQDPTIQRTLSHLNLQQAAVPRDSFETHRYKRPP